MDAIKQASHKQHRDKYQAFHQPTHFRFLVKRKLRLIPASLLPGLGISFPSGCEKKWVLIYHHGFQFSD